MTQIEIVFNNPRRQWSELRALLTDDPLLSPVVLLDLGGHGSSDIYRIAHNSVKIRGRYGVAEDYAGGICIRVSCATLLAALKIRDWKLPEIRVNVHVENNIATINGTQMFAAGFDGDDRAINILRSAFEIGEDDRPYFFRCVDVVTGGEIALAVQRAAQLGGGVETWRASDRRYVAARGVPGVEWWASGWADVLALDSAVIPREAGGVAALGPDAIWPGGIASGGLVVVYDPGAVTLAGGPEQVEAMLAGKSTDGLADASALSKKGKAEWADLGDGWRARAEHARLAARGFGRGTADVHHMNMGDEGVCVLRQPLSPEWTASALLVIRREAPEVVEDAVPVEVASDENPGDARVAQPYDAPVPY